MQSDRTQERGSGASNFHLCFFSFLVGDKQRKRPEPFYPTPASSLPSATIAPLPAPCNGRFSHASIVECTIIEVAGTGGDPSLSAALSAVDSCHQETVLLEEVLGQLEGQMAQLGAEYFFCFRNPSVRVSVLGNVVSIRKEA